MTGLRKYHATSCRPRPSASRNFNRNKLVAEYIESMTGIKRTTKQIASRIQVLRDAWKGKKGTWKPCHPDMTFKLTQFP